MDFVVNKPLVIRGVTYRPGDPFDRNIVDEHKLNQFLRQRLIRPSFEEAKPKEITT